MNKLLVAALAALTVSGTATAASTMLVSGPEQVQLVELYTSEGCSSCPPADSWMTKLRRDDRLWKKVVPIAFHVDYWDYIGWPDRFASAEHTLRQHQHAGLRNVRSVYTPGFVVNGREWREWFAGEQLPAARGNPGVLKAVVSDGTVTVEFAPDALPSGRVEVVVARLGFGHATDIRGGENSGRTLWHDFVVLGMGKTALAKTGADGKMRASIPLPAARLKSEREGLAVWVTEAGQQRPLQTVGGYIASVY
jgi:hypothetical protein